MGLHISNDLQKILMPSNRLNLRGLLLCGHGTYHKDGKSEWLLGYQLLISKRHYKFWIRFLILDSCYAGGKEYAKVHLPDGTIPCPILVRSSFESVTFSSRRDRFLSQVISQVEKYLFRNITYPKVKQIQRNAIQQIIAALPKQKKCTMLPSSLIANLSKTSPKYLMEPLRKWLMQAHQRAWSSPTTPCYFWNL